MLSSGTWEQAKAHIIYFKVSEGLGVFLYLLFAMQGREVGRAEAKNRCGEEKPLKRK